VSSLLEPLRVDPAKAAVLTDVDGTLAPIVERPEQAGVPEEVREVLRELSKRFALVGCVSGRRASEARRLVGIGGIAYAGNHGLELLLPEEAEPRLDASLARSGTSASSVALDRRELEETGLRIEDKGPIQALHWRGAEDEAAAEALARKIATRAAEVGLHPHWGRKVLELRPLPEIGKDVAVKALLAGTEVRAAIYAGDDTTDLDAFRGLRELRERGDLEAAICIGILSAEAPPGLAEGADLTVAGPGGWLEILQALAG
jgi:trehalose 6-phosphate phosphatase